MAQVLIRNIDDKVAEKLRVLASQNGRSLEAELRSILSDVAAEKSQEKNRVEIALEIQRMFEGRAFSDSAQMVREDREGR
jgi:plasmid stability protein